MFVCNIFLRNIIQNQLYTNYKSKTTTKPPSYPYNERNLGYLFPSIVSVTYYLILYWQKAVHSFQKYLPLTARRYYGYYCTLIAIIKHLHNWFLAHLPNTERSTSKQDGVFHQTILLMLNKKLNG